MVQWFQTRQGKVALGIILICLCVLGLLLLSTQAKKTKPLSKHLVAPKAMHAQLKSELQVQLPPSPTPDTVNPLQAVATSATQNVARFYEQRQWQPLWDAQRYDTLLTQIRALADDGLNPEDYSLNKLERCQSTNSTCAQTTERELLATQAYLLALDHLYNGKVKPVELYPEWNFQQVARNSEETVKQALAAAENRHIEAMFQNARPSQVQYQRLRTELQALRQLAATGGWPTLPLPTDKTTPSLKPGMIDERVKLLRQRLQLSGLLSETVATTETASDIQNASDENTSDKTTNAIENNDPAYFDSALENAVKRYQTSIYLVADGAVGKKTLEQLNVPVENRIKQLRVNLERLRWQRPIIDDYVIVDVAGYNISYVRDGKIIWQSRVQVGTHDRQTPMLQSAITHITLNPQWTIPPTILRKDTLPAIRKDRSYLTKHHIRALDSEGQQLSADDIDWGHPGNITLRQDAGTDAALGQLAIRFPNDYSVYLHETPHQTLFNAEQRNFSSGCIRVENVRDLAILLFNDAEKWNREALEMALTDMKTREVKLAKKVPILIDYWTVDVDENGYVSYRPDVYDKDKDVLAALDAPIQ